MSGITIAFEGTKSTGDWLNVILFDGEFRLTARRMVDVACTPAADPVHVLTTLIALGTAHAGEFGATIKAPLVAIGSGSPRIRAEGFTGTATVTWPTADGEKTQRFGPEEFVELAGFGEY